MKTLAFILSLLLLSSTAHADAKRVRVPVSALPRQDHSIKIDGTSAMLPDGVRDGSPVPKSWKVMREMSLSEEFGHCTDDRRGSVADSGTSETSTEKIWETNGKVFFDRARVKVADGKVQVISAERLPVVYVSESIWAYRNGNTLRLVFARDAGVFSRAIFWGCSVDEIVVPFPTGATVTTSSPDEVNRVVKQVLELSPDRKEPPPPPWKGVELTVLASVSKATADDEPMLNLVIKRP